MSSYDVIRSRSVDISAPGILDEILDRYKELSHISFHVIVKCVDGHDVDITTITMNNQMKNMYIQ